MHPANRGVDVCVEGPEHHPECPHGPTLLFTRYYEEKAPRRFYACSAFRDRKGDGCNFFQWADEPVKPEKEEMRRQINTLHKPAKSHPENDERRKRIVAEGDVKFCLQCDLLLLQSEWKEHETHEGLTSVSNSQLLRPSRILKPITDEKSYAQYLFSKESVDFFVSMLVELKVTHVVCIGCPTLHESLQESHLHSFLLDLDHRYTQFHSQKAFQRFNVFNCHFFEGLPSQKTFLQFLKSGSKGKLAFFLDPPFGGLSSVISTTLTKLQSMAKPLEPEIFWVFPHFLEKQLTDACPSLKMLDYKVSYVNYGRNSKRGSHVRLYTTASPENVKLPVLQGYWLCGKCRRYSSRENKHCVKCNACPSKDGRTYVHCDTCGTCVKPDWVHCKSCAKCMPPSHECARDEVKKIGCHICGDLGHKRRDCPQKDPVIVQKATKRKRQSGQAESTKRRRSLRKANSHSS
eukprot:m.173504 g.173504  ORF g.173504 m.173504 type:complete len:460 (+) comp39095_c0_seq32:60-1439(+)